RDAGVEDIVVVEDGDLVHVRAEGPVAKGGRTDVGQVAVWDGEEVHDAVLQDRTSLARAGVLSVAAAVDRRGKPLGRAKVTAIGVVGPRDGDILEVAARAVDRAMKDADDRTRESDEALGQ